MIRVVTIASLISILVLVLYLPSAHPPTRFVNQLRAEHDLATDFWGADAGARILARMLDRRANASGTAPTPSISILSASNSVNSAVAMHMAQVNARLVNNEYFRSIDALFALATYRLCMLEQGLPLFALFLGAALFDGSVARVVRSKEFLQHDPEKFALYICAAMIVACATIIALVVPMTVHPLIFCVVPLTMSIFASRALANFHRRA